MISFRRVTAALLGAVLLALPFSGCASTKNDSERFEKFTHDAFVDSISQSLLDLHYTLSDPEAYGIKNVPATLGRYDLAEMENEDKELKKTRKELDSFRYEALTPEQQLTYDVLSAFVDVQLMYDGLSLYNEPTTTTGIQSSLSVLLAEYRFDKLSDVDDYLTLLEDVGPTFDSILAFQQERSKQGLFMADFTADTIIKGLEDFAASRDDNYMLSTFEDKLALFPDLTEEQRTKYVERNREGVMKALDAYTRLADGMRALKGTGVNEGGLCNLPKGKAFYEALVASATGSARNVKEMDKWLDKRMDKSFSDFYTLLVTTPNADELFDMDIEMSDPAEILEHLRGAIAEEFPSLGDVTYQLKTVHPAMQESMSPAFYLTPPFDAVGQNPIYTNPFYMSDRTHLYLYTTLAHEGFPGHLYQNNFYGKVPHDPVRNVMNFNGFSEGWGTYAEMLSYRHAPIEDPVAAEMQRINQELVLYLYCKIDIGVHYFGWMRDDVATFLQESGFNPEAADDVFEAVVGDPSNYLSYGVGYFEHMELREYAETQLGDAFSPVDYHTALLSTGPAPFAVLKKQVEQYVRGVKDGAAASASVSSAAAA